MILNNSFYSLIWKKRCRIEDNMVVAQDRDGNPWQVYNPFDEKNGLKPLYFKFASLNTVNDIAEFISEFGFIFKEWNDFTVADGFMVKGVKVFETVEENLDDIKKEIFLMRSIIELKKVFEDDTKQQSTTNRDFSKIISIIDFIYSINGRNIEQDFPEKYPEMNYMKIGVKERMHPREIAWELICIELNYKLKNTHQVIYYAPLSGEFKENINCPNLLTAMYVLLYQHIITGKKFRRCENETCTDWFLVDTNHDKKYCNETCARLQAQREYRRRLKNKKGNVKNDR